MFVIEVIPLKRGVQVDTLSYFSAVTYSEGTLLHIPMRNTEVLGIVVSVTEVSRTKAALRAATFSLRKLPVQEQVTRISPALLKTARELLETYPTHLGGMLYALLPPEIRTGEQPLPHTHHVESSVPPLVPEVFQATESERHIVYRSLIRETFAHSGSVLYVVPSSIDADTALSVLSSGIEDRAVMLGAHLTKRAQRASYTALEDYSKPKLIITTPSRALLERHDITCVIIEHARSPHYKEQVRPYLDYRDALTVHARKAGRRLIYGDMLVRSEEEHARRSDLLQTYDEAPKRINLSGTLKVVRMKDRPDGVTPFRLFSPTVIEAIEETQKQKGHTFLFAARRGLAPVVACADCGFIFRSPDTGAPYSLVRIKKHDTETRWFVCSSSGRRERAADVCSECGSWRLRERGIGIQHIYDELSSVLPKTPVILFDHTTAKTYKKALFLRDKFYSTKGAIMLGTPMAIPYLTKSITTSVVTNMDALNATPTWRLHEENLALLLRLRACTTDTLYVQMRTESDEMVELAKRGALERFYTGELELRKMFNYPPFTVFIHLTWQGAPPVIREMDEVVQKVLASYGVITYAAPPVPKGRGVHYGLVRVAAPDWPDVKLMDILRALPPSIRIVINPDRIV